MTQYAVSGAGLGLRRGLLPQLLELEPEALDFLELAPENWIGIGGRFRRQFLTLAERFPLVCHGLSLSIGSPAPLDMTFLKAVKRFLDEHRVLAYTEHLSYCSDDKGHLYDLMPIPFTEEAANYVAERVRVVQDVLERRIGLEHVSCYATPGQQMDEVDFVNRVLEQADCGLLLDVNNIYVNAINFRFDPYDYLARLDTARTMYVHIAGHYHEAEDLRVDTHGSAVAEDVWQILDAAYSKEGALPTLLERDFNFPPMAELLAEIARIRSAQQSSQRRAETA